ncbi:MAG: type II toxin-antitoxin system death-on-curing family toxin [Prosthecobacter sp.]|nr:type II toxin-antitoxin system death-on-curing family toxin [Prosthecobacter sp.]
MEDPVWISKEVVLALHERQLAEHGGATGVRDAALLESALARPQQLWTYGQPPPDLCALAAAYAFGLAKNHAFFDGNKRTAFVVYRLFLLRNGIAMTATKEDRYLSMWHLASGEHTEDSFAQWLREHTAPIQAGA